MERQEETPQVPLIVARIQAPTGDLDEFMAQYCRYFGVDVVFLPTEGLQPPGRQVRFTFALADGTEVITGDGVVLRMRRDTGNPQRPPGMELRYQILDEGSQRLVDQMIELRTRGGAQRPDPPPYVSMWFEHEVVTRNGHLGNPAGVKIQLEPPPTDLARATTEPDQPAWAVIAERRREETQRVEPLHGALPANPFADVSASALCYFVDWAIERATDPKRRWSSGAYGGIALAAPGSATRRRGLAVFSAGLIAGGAVFMLGGLIALRMTRPRVRVPSVVAAASSAFGFESGARAAAPSLGVGGGALAFADARSRPRAPAHETPAPHQTAPLASVELPAAGSPLSIVSHPAGAQVRIDGRLRGRAPLVVDLEAGQHEVTLERPRYAPTRIVARAPGRIVAELERPSATLEIQSAPAGARVTVDGRALGVTPLSLTTTAYERHRVQLELDGAVVRRRPYVKPPGDTLSVDLSR